MGKKHKRSADAWGGLLRLLTERACVCVGKRLELRPMDKSTAIKLLGGTPTAAANKLGVTRQSVAKWPPILPRRIEDRVLAALMRAAIASTHCERTKRPPKLDKDPSPESIDG